MKALKIAILGYGEVGKAIRKFYKEAECEDKNNDVEIRSCDILHVCIPYSAQFVQQVRAKIKKAKPRLVVIHSTVPIGTTLSLGKKCVHSPIRGVHPELYQGVKTFVKYVGYEDKTAGQFAQKHLRSIGMNVRLVAGSKNTEALKLWDTTQYGLLIVLNKEIKRYCEAHKLDFDVVYTSANQSYNEGYTKLGRAEVVRPWLRYMEGRIGGHCVIPNCLLLDTEISNFILRKNDTTGNL